MADHHLEAAKAVALEAVVEEVPQGKRLGVVEKPLEVVENKENEPEVKLQVAFAVVPKVDPLRRQTNLVATGVELSQYLYEKGDQYKVEEDHNQGIGQKGALRKSIVGQDASPLQVANKLRVLVELYLLRDELDQ